MASSSKESPSTRTSLTRAIAALVCLLLAAGAGAFAARSVPAVVGENRDRLDSRIVQSVELKEQVVLMSLGVQGIAEERVAKTIFGKKVPGTDKALFLQYDFGAKLGIEGRDVTVDRKDEGAVLVKIPRFIYIGVINPTFKIAVEQEGSLSWFTPDIDTAETVSEILSTDALQRHVDENRELLESQARAFYSGIIKGIDPTINIEFEFERP